MHFVPSGKVQMKIANLPPHCNGPRKIVRREGTFVGTIRFTGENGYTSVDTQEAAGSVGDACPIHLRNGRPGGAPR